MNTYNNHIIINLSGLIPRFKRPGLQGESETRRWHGLGLGRGIQRGDDLRLWPGVLWEVYLRSAEPWKRLEDRLEVIGRISIDI